MNQPLNRVKEFWEKGACGEALYLKDSSAAGYLEQSRTRYELEPFIASLAAFESWKGKRILEVGVGLGADHQRFAESGAQCFGLDLTQQAVKHVHVRFKALNLRTTLLVGDGEHLPFLDGTFDLVYAWGVFHHSPNTALAFREAMRVIRPGGELRAMIYHKWSMVGFMLWLRYALLRFRPWIGLQELYAHYLESPGTKAYSREEGLNFLSGWEQVHSEVVLTHGDLLTSKAGQRHAGAILSLARIVWPRWLIRALFSGKGLFLMLRGVKPKLK